MSQRDGRMLSDVDIHYHIDNQFRIIPLKSDYDYWMGYLDIRDGVCCDRDWQLCILCSLEYRYIQVIDKVD